VDHAEKELGRARAVVEECLRRVLGPGEPLPAVDDDWVERELLDSMAHVDVLLCIEQAAGIPGLFERYAKAPPTTIGGAVAALQAAARAGEQSREAGGPAARSPEKGARPRLVGWGSALGSLGLTAEAVEAEFQLAPGVLSQRAGIESVARAAPAEDELTLARAAAQQALGVAGVTAQQVDAIVATSETFLSLPSLGAALHARLGARADCRVLDIGGACVGVLNGFAVAAALPDAECILIVSADVHSRVLVPGKVAGEFAGLFGDGASAFLLRRGQGDGAYVPVVTLGGCVGVLAGALQVRPDAGLGLRVDFEGEALARAAVEQMSAVLARLEAAGGSSRAGACAFALHQPNPRVLDMLLRAAKLPPEKVPRVAQRSGNLGSSTCGVALSLALQEHGAKAAGERGSIFAAAVGPGMLWAGMLLE
jgi:3-oxoacyl-[acyl-carrier-protein] synthase III